MSRFNAHLVQVLENNSLSQEKLERFNMVRKEIAEYLQAEFGAGDMTVFNSGSIAKRTAIWSSDLDIAVRFNKTYDQSPENIYDEVHHRLKQKYKGQKQVIRQRVTIKVKEKGVLVDVLPCKEIDNTFISIWNIMDNREQKSSLTIHIDEARQVNPIIQLMKIWRRQQGLNRGKSRIGGFLLEQWVIQALRGNYKPTYAENFITVLSYISQSILAETLVNPTNNEKFKIRQGTHKRIKALADSFYQAYKEERWEDVIRLS